MKKEAITIKWTKTNDEWSIIYKEKVFKADTLEKLFIKTYALGISLDEIEVAYLEVDRNDHNYAEFGGFKKSFIFSEKR